MTQAFLWLTVFDDARLILNGNHQGFTVETMPNVSLYLTTKGPTYNVRTGYRWDNDLFLIAGAEFVLSGKQQVEGTLGLRKVFPNLGNLYIYAETVFNTKAVGGTVSVGGTFNKMINAEAGLAYYNNETFFGERHIPFVWKGSTDIHGKRI